MKTWITSNYEGVVAEAPNNVPTSPSPSKHSLVLLAEEGLAQYQGASLGIYDPINFR